MASSSTSFPSSTSSTLTTTTSASTTTSSSSSDNGGIPSKGANYFFGFLITFIVLLSFFICCGFGTRRNLARRRALLAWGQGDSDSVIGRDGQLNESDIPTLFEPRFLKGDSDPYWLSVQPLTAKKIAVSSSSNNHVQPPLLPPPSPIRRPSQNPHALHGLSLPTWIPAPSFNSPSSNDEKKNGKGISTSTNLNDDATVLQVAVVITMPCRPTANGEREGGTQNNLEIGVTCEVLNSSTNAPGASEGQYMNAIVW
ncbi:hypothetical protein F5890DRAFT_659576 [Lentinula detonsa]|uniref:Uncharacterized protein n=1 Tax=Lentinula detonsa TaxID=2804962 RepID=A0AA38UW75_9AGAR|nr:hypothetical protein F5890DRAFT_659576 [Lentinula detonsa]